MERVLRVMVEDARERGGLDLTECFIDGTFVVAKKGRRGGKDQAGQGYEDHGSGRIERETPYLLRVGHPQAPSYLVGIYTYHKYHALALNVEYWGCIYACGVGQFRVGRLPQGQWPSIFRGTYTSGTGCQVDRIGPSKSPLRIHALDPHVLLRSLNRIICALDSFPRRGRETLALVGIGYKVYYLGSFR